MRAVIGEDAKRRAFAEIEAKLQYRLAQKGPRSYASTHEILGIIAEEFHELVEAVRSNDRRQIMEELKDIAVACVFGIACDREKALEW